MPVTTDRNDPRLTHGVDKEPVDQAPVYIVNKDGEFVRPVRRTYVHWVMRDGRDMPLLLKNEHLSQLTGCGVSTTMAQEIAETYARDPKFYGSTYCVGCRMHLPVSEFSWEDGTRVGS